MIHTLLFLFLSAEPANLKAKANPEVTPQEQITLLKLQVEELAAKNAALERVMARMEGVNKLRDAWNERGCVIESDPQSGLIRCKAKTEETKK